MTIYQAWILKIHVIKQNISPKFIYKFISCNLQQINFALLTYPELMPETSLEVVIIALTWLLDYFWPITE